MIGHICCEVSHHFQVPCDQAGESCPLAQARTSGQRERVLHLHHTPQGEEYVNIEISPLRDGSGQQAFFVEKMAPMKVVHSRSVARGQPARGQGLMVDCSSLPETLFESELFGHERGAFTGANTSKPGPVDAASGDTRFLDEVGDIPLLMPVKLLRLLASGSYRRVGSNERCHADIRVVSAMHRDLEALVAQGQFREDLNHRLSTFPIALPPLRERRNGIAMLTHALLVRLAPKAMALLSAQPFPGNVRELRELRNLLERTTRLCAGGRTGHQRAVALPQAQSPELKGCTFSWPGTVKPVPAWHGRQNA
ncbi:sigma 54-interacting transcriptional regulator [Hydrogenophaga sp.]|uniref:sigma 54-interacting transcriptional regulator n=1 Tax=Hydrogenophaga sp. TaxID=1904254 RepID=UPI003F6C08BE